MELFFICSKHIKESARVKWCDMVENQRKFAEKVAKVHEPFR